MSRFNTYAQRVDSMAREIFAEYAEAKTEFDRAEKWHRDLPQRHGMTDYDYAYRSARATADYAEAKKRLEDVRRRMAMKINEVENIGRELAEAVEHDCSVDPTALDMATVELLKTGILRSAEYASLMRDAQIAGNITMQRVIAKYAESAAAEASEKYGQGDRLAAELRAVAHQGSASSGKAQLDMFNTLLDTFRRTMNNASMIPHWDALTANIVENF